MGARPTGRAPFVRTREDDAQSFEIFNFSINS
jgi:hypothetical protein